MAKGLSWNNTPVSLAIDPSGKRKFVRIQYPQGEQLITHQEPGYKFRATLTCETFSCGSKAPIVSGRWTLACYKRD